MFRRLFLLTKMTTATAFRCFASSKESADDVTVSGSTGENRLRFRNPRTRTHSHTQTLRHGRTHTHSHTHTHLAGRRAREKPSSFLAFQGILLGLMTVALVATTTFPQRFGSDHNRQHLFRGLLRFASNFLDVLFFCTLFDGGGRGRGSGAAKIFPSFSNLNPNLHRFLQPDSCNHFRHGAASQPEGKLPNPRRD